MIDAKPSFTPVAAEDRFQPFDTFEPDVAGTLLQGKKIPPDFPELGIPPSTSCHDDAVPRSNGNEMQERKPNWLDE